MSCVCSGKSAVNGKPLARIDSPWGTVRRRCLNPGSGLPESRLILLPARCDADVGKAEQPLDAGPLADVVALDGMADILQQVTQHERADAPVPLLPGQHTQQDNPRDGQGDAQKVNPEIEGVA